MTDLHRIRHPVESRLHRIEHALVQPVYDPAGITVPTLLVGAEWDRDTPPAMRQALFPLLVNAPNKRYVELGRGTHMICLERNRGALFGAVQAFLDEAVAHAPLSPVPCPGAMTEVRRS